MSNDYGKVTRKPSWLKIKLHENSEYAEVAALVKENNLHTICSSGKCPNQAECWSRRTATFMILGDICTRSCKFCATATGKPLPVDPNEPRKVANSIKVMGLRHCVITSVDRDDLPDGGANAWAETVKAIRKTNPDVTIEVLLPDFDNKHDLIDIVLESKPDIIGHNIETVRRLTPQVRSRAQYDRSLQVLEYVASKGFAAKSAIMVGLGETDEEIYETLGDLKKAKCSIVTLGQYLRPTMKHWPVERYVHPDVFDQYKQRALEMGFDFVESAPLVRSSYMADRAAGCLKNKK
jgi:lipoic acid synthetase